MDANQNKQAMQRAFAGLAEGDGSALVALMSDDFAWTIAGVATRWAGTWTGKRVVREELLAALFEQFADQYRNTPVSFTAEADRVVVECRGHVTTKRGRRYDNQYCYVCRFDADGRLRSLVEYADTALMEEALTPPASDGTQRRRTLPREPRVPTPPKRRTPRGRSGRLRCATRPTP